MNVLPVALSLLQEHGSDFPSSATLSLKDRVNDAVGGANLEPGVVAEEREPEEDFDVNEWFAAWFVKEIFNKIHHGDPDETGIEKIEFVI